MLQAANEVHFAINKMQCGPDLTIYSPSFSELVDTLDQMSRGTNPHSCIHCDVSLPGKIDVQLSIVRLTEVDTDYHIGWLVQLCSLTEPNSFLLISPSCSYTDQRRCFIRTDLGGRIERVDARCVISNTELALWLRHELMPQDSDARFRWIDVLAAIRGDRNIIGGVHLPKGVTSVLHQLSNQNISF